MVMRVAEIAEPEMVDGCCIGPLDLLLLILLLSLLLHVYPVHVKD
jgi:hypothetical protein